MATKLRIVFVFFALMLFIYSAGAQSEKIQRISPEGDTLVLEAIPLVQITTSLENDYNLFQDITKHYQDDPKIAEFDSIFEIKTLTLQQKKIDFEESKENYTDREVNNSLVEWGTYEKIASEWKTLINERLSIIEKDLFTIRTRKKVWELTRKEARLLKAPEGILSSVSDMLTTAGKNEKQLADLQNAMLKRQNAISKDILMVNATISALYKIEKQLQSQYFAQDSPPIWAAADSTLSPQVIKNHFKKSIQDNIKGVKLFIESYKQTMYLHIFLFLLIWLGFYFLRKQSEKFTNDDNTFELQQAHTAISRHLLSALVISLFISVWLYPDLNSTIADIFQLTYIVIAIIFFPAYINKQLRPILYGILVLFFLNQSQVFFPFEMLFSRLVLFIKAILSGWILYQMLNSSGMAAKELKRNKMSFVIMLLRLFFVFLVLSIIGNIFGSLSLSILLCNAVVEGIINLIILLLVVIMFNRGFIILLRTSFVRNSNYINDHRQLVEKRVRETIFIIALFIWIRRILSNLNLLKPLTDWLKEVGQTSWEVGNSTIEFSGIIDFFIVIILTTLIYRVIKTLFETELFPRVKLPRGVPGAISMILGYVIVAYGIFLALAAAGIDLSEFGLMAGALGVGIGFGLQNIVANFIAGLILAFERPIQVGDTIEAGTVMGDVKSIGVRACTIRTFDGSEVMIPNGNLIANDVINWTLSDRKKRRDIFVSVAYGSNPHEVLKVIKKVGENHPNVLQVPAPWALFEGFGDSALNFRLRIWTAMDVGLTTKSEVAMGIYDALNEAGIEIPFPQHDLHIKSLDPSVQKINLAQNKKTKKE